MSFFEKSAARKKNTEGNLPIEASANASGKAPAPTSQSAIKAEQPAQQSKPDAKAAELHPQSVAKAAPAPKKEQPEMGSQTIHSNGQTAPGFESANAVTKICGMLDAVKTELAGFGSELNAQKDRLAKLESESVSYRDRLVALENKVKTYEEERSSTPGEQLAQSAPVSVASDHTSVYDASGWYYHNVQEDKWEYTRDKDMARQLSNDTEFYFCYARWKGRDFVSLLDEAGIARLLGTPCDGCHYTFIYYDENGEERYALNLSVVNQLTGGYTGKGVILPKGYRGEYWWWKDGAPERQLTKEEFERNHLG